MEEGPQPGHALRFGLFEADLEAGQLRKDGVRVKLPQQPFQVLVCLLEGSGRVVTREALIAELWPNGTVVEYEHSLGTAINKIRQALGDSADNPEFVETLPRRGYRFLVPVERIGQPPEEGPPQVAALAPQPGATISHYKITEKLGEGGMGVVYKAEDTKLKRPVALKFLAGHLLGHEEIKARFQREAEASAALNHPNVCHVYEISQAEGKTFIAMAFIEGGSLDKKIETGPLKLNEALDIAIQTAQGLRAAHEKNIVHRDIKPANLMVSGDGSKPHVTIMDFGLARLADRSKLSRADGAMGTVSYMSPEQTAGTDVDHRTDIWSLGVALYEMVTGRQPFGHYEQAVTHSITGEEPEPMTGLRTGVPMELEWIVNKCLAKDLDQRYQSTTELVVDLETLRTKLESGGPVILLAQGPVGRVEKRQELQRWGMLGVAVVLVASLGLSVLLWRRGPSSDTSEPVGRFSISGENLQGGGISPDGRYIAYVTKDGDEISTWVRSLDREAPRKLEGMEGATGGFWAPDSRSLGFATGRELRRISVEGGDPITLCKLPGFGFLRFTGGSWSSDGDRIVFGSGRGLYEVSAGGGAPRLLLAPEETEGTKSRWLADQFAEQVPSRGPEETEGTENRWLMAPTLLPPVAGRRGLVYTILSRMDESRLAVVDLETGQRRDLGPGATSHYSASGHLVYQTSIREGGLWALPFSLETLTPTGKAFRIVEEGTGPTLAQNGTLVYTGGAADSQIQLVWKDREGDRLGTIGQPQDHLYYPALSPDEKRVAVTGLENNNTDIWIHEVDRPVKTRLTSHEGTDLFPTWSPRGDRVAFSSGRTGDRDVYTLLADGSGEPVLLVGSADSREYLTDWSPDETILMFQRMDSPWIDSNLSYLRRKQDGSGYHEALFLKTGFDEAVGKLSPDGRFVAYSSNHSGQPEVYIRSFPDGGGRQRVSLNGGAQPRWSKDGKELFYVAGSYLMAVPVSTSSKLIVGNPKPLFSSRGLPMSRTGSLNYDVTSDGQRFVVTEPLAADTKRVIHVVQNWFTEFKDRQSD